MNLSRLFILRPVNNDTFNIGFGGGRVSAMINALESSGFAYTLEIGRAHV